MKRLYFTLLLSVSASVDAQWHQAKFTSMTTAIELEFWEDDKIQATRLVEQIKQRFVDIDRSMNRYDENSELSQLNRTAARETVVSSPSLFQVLQEAREVSILSQGAFDATFASVGYLYDYRAATKPSDARIAELKPLVDYRQVILDAEKSSIRFGHPGIVVDLGGIAKGYAVDEAIRLLRHNGIRSARVSAGGDMRLLGRKDGNPWVIGIKDPRQKDQHAVILPLEDIAVSTSGDYERFFIDDDGERVHHILSPSTGKPAKGIQSVTILGPKTVTTDGLSTAVFVLGVERGLNLINGLPEFDAIIIDSQRKMHYSEGLMAPEQP